MNEHSVKMLQRTRRRATFTLRRLIDEFDLLTASFPDLRDAFDADELPVDFILRRDSRRPERQFTRPTRTSGADYDSRTRAPRKNRGGQRKQPVEH
jgi:hypothetical protein